MPVTRWTLLSVTARYTICGTALYWSNLQGIWGSQDDAESAFNRVVTTSRNYINTVEQKYGKDFFNLEKASQAWNSIAVGSWNTGNESPNPETPSLSSAVESLSNAVPVPPSLQVRATSGSEDQLEIPVALSDAAELLPPPPAPSAAPKRGPPPDPPTTPSAPPSQTPSNEDVSLPPSRSPSFRRVPKDDSILEAYLAGAWISGIQKTVGALSDVGSTAAKLASDGVEVVSKKFESLTKAKKD